MGFESEKIYRGNIYQGLAVMLEEQSLFTHFHYTALAALSTILEQMSCKLNLSTHSNREFYSLLIGASPNECSSSFLALGKTYVHPALLDLLSYDKANNSELFNTLKVFLHCSQSIKDTSAELFVHRNTVVYRIDKICKMYGFDLDDSELRFTLRLSYYLIDLWSGDILKSVL